MKYLLLVVLVMMCGCDKNKASSYSCDEKQFIMMEKEFKLCREYTDYTSSSCFIIAKKSNCTYNGE